MYFWKSRVGGRPGGGGGGHGNSLDSQMMASAFKRRKTHKKGRRGKLQLHGFHLTAAAKPTAALWAPSRGPRRGTQTGSITVSPITGRGAVSAVSTGWGHGARRHLLPLSCRAMFFRGGRTPVSSSAERPVLNIMKERSREVKRSEEEEVVKELHRYEM